MLVCRMRIIARNTLREFVDSLAGREDHRAVKSGLDAWFDIVKKASWQNSAQVKWSFATASIASSDRIVFNINGNAYRLVTAMDFKKWIVWIKWIGSHRDYDRIDALEIEHDG